MYVWHGFQLLKLNNKCKNSDTLYKIRLKSLSHTYCVREYGFNCKFSFFLWTTKQMHQWILNV